MVLSTPPLLAADERAWNYWFVDGLTNIVVGANTLMFAFAVFFPPHWPPKALPLALWAIALISYVAIVMRYKQIVEWLKARITYPRTGYVQSPSPDSAEAANLITVPLGTMSMPPEVQIRHLQRRTSFTITIALVAIACFAFLLIHQRWVWTATGTMFSIALIIARRDFGISWILPLGFPILGLYITRFAPRHMGASYFIIGMGLLFLLDGIVTLVRYLIQNPRPKSPAA